MKHVTYFVGLLLAISLLACEKNDTLAEISTQKGYVPNVYLSNLAPIAFAGTPIAFEVQYWSVDNKFGEMGLWERLDTTALVQFKLAPASAAYTYSVEYSGVRQAETLLKAEDHDFTNWSSDKSAYVLQRSYTAGTGLKKLEYNERKTTKAAYIALLPDTLKTHLYTDLAKSLSKSHLNTILVQTHSLITSAELDSYYDAEGALTATGRSQAEAQLRRLTLDQLIGTNYKLVRQTTVGLRYKVNNPKGDAGRSVMRSFTIQ